MNPKTENLPRRLPVGRLMATLAGAALAAGCGSFAGSLPLGAPIAEARAAFASTGEHPLPGGGRRLEFAQGQFGKQTYMLDFDAAGTLVAKEQVLTEANFAKIAPGMSAQEVRTRLGRPARVFSVGWQRLEVWNYRYFDGDCVWFQISISQAAGTVTEAGMGQDPACDGPNERD